jgi:hypothetical protein
VPACGFSQPQEIHHFRDVHTCGGNSCLSVALYDDLLSFGKEPSIYNFPLFPLRTASIPRSFYTTKAAAFSSLAGIV